MHPVKHTGRVSFFYGYIKVDGVSSVFCFIWGWEEPAWGLPFQFHGGLLCYDQYERTLIRERYLSPKKGAP